MKGRQLWVVLAILAIVGIAGLVLRVVSSAEDEVVLSGLVPLERNFIDKIVVKSPESEATLVRIQENWFVNGNQQVFAPKMDQFWGTVAEIDSAGLIALNTANHERLGVTDPGAGTEVSFFLGGAIQERFIVGTWASDVRLCYLRRAGKNPVYGIECPAPATSIFDPNPDGWRNPIVVAIPPQEIEALVYSHPDQEFLLSPNEQGWTAANAEEQVEADPFLMQAIVSNFEVMVAIGFADDDEADELIFDAATPSIRIVTIEGAGNPTTRIRFLPRDEETYYVKTGARSTVFIIERGLAEFLLQSQEAFGLGLSSGS